MSEVAPETRKLDIRKYPNRRYYDATRSQHVRLEEIHELIRHGHEIQVTDSKTGQDITAKVLAQIILDLDPPKLDVFSVPLLHRLIRANERLLQDFTEKYFNQALDSFLQSQRQFETYLRQAIGLKTGVPEWARMFNPFMGSFWSGLSSNGNGGPGPGNPAGVQNLRQELSELEARMEHLRQQIAQKDGKESDAGSEGAPAKA